VFKSLKNIWKYSDSQPTEITLAIAMSVLAPIATLVEIGFMPFFQLALVAVGIYQLRCVALGELSCRIRAAFMTFSLYSTSFLMYIINIGMPTPTHYGWLIFVLSSLSSLRRLKTEELHRNG
jgi:hypothetical protein